MIGAKWIYSCVQYLQIFGVAASCTKTVPCFNITPTILQVGSSFLQRRTWCNVTKSACGIHRPLHRQLKPLSSLMTCIRMNWMCILVSDTATVPNGFCLVSILLPLKGLYFLSCTLLLMMFPCCYVRKVYAASVELCGNEMWSLKRENKLALRWMATRMI